MNLDFSCCDQVHPNEVHRRKRVAVFEDSGWRLPWSFVCSQRRTGTSVLVTVHQIPNTCSQIPTDSKTPGTTHRPHSGIKYQQKMTDGAVSTFSKSELHRISFLATKLAQRLLTTGPQACKIIHASLGSCFGQQAL